MKKKTRNFCVNIPWNYVHRCGVWHFFWKKKKSEAERINYIQFICLTWIPKKQEEQFQITYDLGMFSYLLVFKMCFYNQMWLKKHAQYITPVLKSNYKIIYETLFCPNKPQWIDTPHKFTSENSIDIENSHIVKISALFVNLVKARKSLRFLVQFYFNISSVSFPCMY